MGEIAPFFASSADAREYFKQWRICRLHPGVMDAAADVDKQLIGLGENDTWIAGFARYYREPVVSLAAAFERVPALRRMAY